MVGGAMAPLCHNLLPPMDSYDQHAYRFKHFAN